jgi:hypothetical protein
MLSQEATDTTGEETRISNVLLNERRGRLTGHAAEANAEDANALAALEGLAAAAGVFGLVPGDGSGR